MMQDYEQELTAIRELLKKNPDGMSVTDISKALKKNKNTTGRYLDILLISGQVDMRTFGMAKVYTLSQRVPLSAMLSYSKELIMVLDNESRITDINENFLQLLQLPRKDAIGKNISYLQPPEVDVHELLDSAIKTSGERETTLTFHVRDKGDRIFRQKRIPTVYDDGQKGMTFILEDVTEHILAEREIRESEERFRMMADNIQDGLMILENGKAIYSNNRIAEISGYSISDLQSMEPLRIIAPESHEVALQLIRMIEDNPDKPQDVPVWIIRKDNERRFVFVRISGVRYHGSIMNFIIFTDVTRLKDQEAKVLESEERFRMIADNIHDGLIIIENDKIVFSNRRIREITGYSADELAEMGLNRIHITNTEQVGLGEALSPDSRNIEEIFRDIKPGSDNPYEFKIWIRRKDNGNRYIHGKITAVMHGKVTIYYLTLTDITDYAERERILRERIDALQDLLH